MLDRRTFLTAFLAMRGTARSEDLPNTHNMMLVGEGTAFLSHLPMFRMDNSVPELNDLKTEYTSPHRFQVVLEAVFTRGGKDVTPTYFIDRKSNPKVNMYTVRPEEFVLSRLFTPDAQNPALRSFPATVFRGHLERRPNRRILQDVTVEVKRVIHARQFDPKGIKPAALEYILFGRGADLFASHFIGKPPDFDQIVSVTLDHDRPTDEQLGHGVRMTLASRKNTAAQRLRPAEKAQAEIRIGGSPVRAQIQAVREFYFEEGELLSPPTFSSTTEERKAGF